MSEHQAAHGAAPTNKTERDTVTPEQRLDAIIQQIDNGQLSDLDPGSLAVLQLYYLTAASLNRIANHFESQQGA